MINTDILVIGNGFDLWCKLNSRYEDFAKHRKSCFHSFYSELDLFLERTVNTKREQLTKGFFNKNIQYVMNEYRIEINFWEIYFEITNYRNNGEILWLNIEQDIHDFLDKEDKVNTTIYYLHQIIKRGVSVDDNPRPIIDSKTTLAYLLYFVLIAQQEKCTSTERNDSGDNLNIYVEGFNLKIFSQLSRYLLKELNRFEKSFCNYLREEVNTNKEYDSNANVLVEKITSELSNKVITSESRDVYYLNFNYTLPRVKQGANNGTNVHGYLGDDNNIGEIIIGIDHEHFEATSTIYTFTKTYRKLFLRQDLQSQPLPSRKFVKRIIFYGHSYGKADYSYFRSVFDFYNIEKSDVQLVFYYTVYDETKRDEISHKQYKDVANLLNDYSKSANTNSGKNLMHRLLLEHRLTIREIESNT